MSALPLLAAGGCDTINQNLLGGAAPPQVGTPGYVSGFLGGVVADEPRAALIGRDVLSGGGNAADAAVAMALAMSVTLPSRAGLGGGGVCIAYDPDTEGPGKGVPDVVMFTPAAVRGAGSRPAGVPMLARGLFALHARYGHLQFEQLVSRAEQLARFGTPLSRAFARDIAVVAAPLAADPGTAPFFGPNHQPLAEGANLQQPDLAATLATLRVQGVGDLYQGTLAKRIVTASPGLGAGLSGDLLRASLPRFVVPNLSEIGRDELAVPPTDTGAAVVADIAALANTPGDHGGDLGANFGARPASAGLVALDRDGKAVACALSMGNLFGTGRVVPGTGMLLGASPAALPPPLLAPALVYNANIHAFRAAVVGTGQAAAPMAAAVAIRGALSAAAMDPVPNALPIPPPDPGRADAIACGRYLPGSRDSCSWAVDPRLLGLAVGSN